MDVVTAQERGREDADDARLLAEALADRRVMLTNDTDFLVLAARHSAQGETFAPIYFWPQQGRSVGEIVRRVLRAASVEDYTSACSRVHFL
jgi:predicted nuclease of predicted toxin-antitoxin system